MDGDDLRFYLFLIFVVISLVQRVLKAMRKKAPVPEGEAGGVDGPAGRANVLGRIETHLRSIRDRAQAVLASLDQLSPEIAERLGTVLRDRVLPQVEQLSASVVKQGELQGEEPGDTDDETEVAIDLRAIGAELQSMSNLVSIVKVMADQRRDPATRQVLGDADALAEACYRPILDFADHHMVPMQSNYPLTVLHRGGAAIHVGFLRYQLAPIALPPAFRDEPWRWPAIAHEIAHDMVAAIPGLREEIVRELGLERDADEAELAAGSEALNLAFFNLWVDEIFADAIGSLMIGPAYLRSMIEIFARPESPIEVSAILVTRDGQVDPHPPRHLRVHMTEHFLYRMGYGARARELRESWDAMHGPPPAIVVVSPAGQQPLPAEPMLAFGDAIMDRLYNLELQTLVGHRLADIPGLEFGAAHARRAEQAQRNLARGLPAAFDARSLIAAATEAALDARDDRLLIQEAMQKSIVGIGTDERASRVREMAAAEAWEAAPAVRTEPAPAPAARPAPAMPPATPVVRRRRLPAAARGRTRVRPPLLPLDRRRVVDALLLGEIIEPQSAERRRRARSRRATDLRPRV